MCVGHCGTQGLLGEDQGKVHFLTYLFHDLQCWMVQKGANDYLDSFLFQSDKSVNHQFISLSLPHTSADILQQTQFSRRHTQSQVHTQGHQRWICYLHHWQFAWRAQGRQKKKPEVDSKPAWLQTLSCTASGPATAVGLHHCWLLGHHHAAPNGLQVSLSSAARPLARPWLLWCLPASRHYSHYGHQHCLCPGPWA